MAFQFPNAPTLGQVYKPTIGPPFTWDGLTWVVISEGAPMRVFISDTAPLNPSTGQMWWQSSTGDLFIRYVDIDTTQWVQVNGVPVTVVAMNARMDALEARILALETA